jgi:hypothetical protein
MVVEVVLILRGKIQLSLYLRKDERNIGVHQKRERGIRELLEQKRV